MDPDIQDYLTSVEQQGVLHHSARLSKGQPKERNQDDADCTFL